MPLYHCVPLSLTATSAVAITSIAFDTIAIITTVTDAVNADAINTLRQHLHHLKENNHSQMYSQDNVASDGVLTAANSQADLVAVTLTLAIEWWTG